MFIVLCMLLTVTSCAFSQTQTAVTTYWPVGGQVAYFTGNGAELETTLLYQAQANWPWGTGRLFVQGSLEILSNLQLDGGGAVTAYGGFEASGNPGDSVNGAPLYGLGQSTVILNQGSNGAIQVAGYNGLNFQTGPQNGHMVIRGDNGNVGVNTLTPGAQFEVNGNVKLTAGSGASVTYADGTVQSTAWNGTLLGGDYSESIDVVGERSRYEPGDLIAIDPSAPGKFIKASSAYSKLVAGIYSTKPGLVGRRATSDRPNKEAEVPMAMMGIVPTKVTTENGPIEAGDMLVASSRAGYAMKGTDRNRMVGATVGKALAPLAAGQGTIEVLVSLQ